MSRLVRAAILPAALFISATLSTSAQADNLDIFPSVQVENELVSSEFFAHFGYENVGVRQVVNIFKDHNWIDDLLGVVGLSAGQPVVFHPGVHEDVFNIEFSSDNELTWYMGRSTYDYRNSVGARASDGISYVRPVSGFGSSYTHLATSDPILSKQLFVEDGGNMTFAGGDFSGFTFQVGGTGAPAAVNFTSGTLTLVKDTSPTDPVSKSSILIIEDGGEFRALGGTLNIKRLDVKPGGRFIASVPTLNVGNDVMLGLGEMVFIDTTLESRLFLDAGSSTTIVGDVYFNAPVFGPGNFFGGGTAHFNSSYEPGASPSIIEHENSIAFGSGGRLEIELAGTGMGEFDRLEIMADLMLDGTLDVSLIDGFALSLNQEFEILNVTGTQSGEFLGLANNALVGNFGGTDLFISYTTGDGNDVALYTAVPEPTSLVMLGLSGVALLRRRR